MTQLDQVRAAISECFASDPELVERWHIAAGSGLRSCIERTMYDVARFEPTFKFYPVLEDGKLVAYWGTERGCYINLIFVKPSHRRPDFMKRFWAQIQDSVPDVFYAGLYAKNFPAVDFYRNRGGELETFQYDGQWLSVFTFKKVGA